MKILKKSVCFLFLACILSALCYSQTVNNRRITVEITDVVINGGKVNLTVFSSADNFKNGIPDFEFVLEANNTTVYHELSLPNGECVISVYQDANNNGKLDNGMFGIPKELVGISNYFGNGYPSKSFDKHKILINDLTGKITVRLYKF